jgi:phospholipid N-methyltransferase
MIPSRTVRERTTAAPRNLVGYLNFFWAGLRKQGQTGALVPSQRFLIEKMIAPIPETYRGNIVELGAGTGAITRHLAARCRNARILACEINPVLAQDSKRNLVAAGVRKQVEVISRSAEELLSEMILHGKADLDFVISGIPLGNLPGNRVVALIDVIHQALRPGGMYIQFQHSLLDRKKIRAKFNDLRTVPVPINFPPAVVYYATK